MPHAFVLLKSLLVIVLGIGVYRMLIGVLRFLVHTQHLPAPLLVPLRGLVRAVTFTLVALVVLQQMGVQVTSLWAGMLTLAAMIAGGFVALSSVVSNFLCTFLLLVLTPFRVGDEVEIVGASGVSDLRGTVVNLTLFYTSLQLEAEPRRQVAHVPNTLFFQQPIRCQQALGPSPATSP